MKNKYKEITFQHSTNRIYPNGDKNAQFAKSYNWLMRRRELSPGAKHVYNRLGQYAGEKNYARVKQETLALETGFCLRQVKTYIKELVHFGLIEIQQLGLNKSNIYYFLDHPWKYSEVQDPALLEVQDLTSLEVQDPALPFNRSLNKKILLKENTQESVCVSKNEVSIYSKKEWLTYAQAQKNVYSPQALAEKLSQSRENDHLMEAFLQSKLEIEQQQKSTFEQNQQQSLELEERKQSIITEMLALKTLEPWHVKFLNAHGYCVPQQQVC